MIGVHMGLAAHPPPPAWSMMRRALGSVTATLVVTMAVAVLSTAPVAANSGDINDYYGRINSFRTANGLAPLAIDGALAASSQSWAQQMAATGVLAHDPGLGSAVSGWLKLGENVGFGGGNGPIWDAFLASPGHAANLLDPEFTHMGVGVVYNGSTQWTAHRFMKSGAAPAPAPPPTAPAQAPAPPPTAAPTPTPTEAPPATAPAAPESAPPDNAEPETASGSEPRPTPADPGRVREVLTALRVLG